jgi:hypothetical protein
VTMLAFPQRVTGRAEITQAQYRLMADSATPWRIPAAFNSPDRLIAWYLDGRYAWSARQLARFPRAVKVAITVTGNLDADVADVETGDMGPQDFADWLKARMAAGNRWHALYSDKDTKPGVDAAVEAAGLSNRDYGWWAADPAGEPHEVPGALAVQYFWGTGAENYDVSAVYASGWHPAEPYSA